MEKKRTTEFRIISAVLLVMLVLLNLASTRHFHICLVRQMTQEQPVAHCCVPQPPTSADRDHSAGNGDCHSTGTNDRTGCDCILDSQPPIDERKAIARTEHTEHLCSALEQVDFVSLAEIPTRPDTNYQSPPQARISPVLHSLAGTVLLI